MNEAQREVLKMHHMDLIRDLVVTEELLGSCYQHKLFDTYFIDSIRSQPTQAAQTTKLLEYLPKRGPEAFYLFVKIIQPSYPWLSAALTTSLEQHTNTNQKPEQSDSIGGLTNRSGYNGFSNHSDHINNNNDYGNKSRAQSVRHNDSLGNTDPLIKGQIEHFVQTHFCLSRKLSENDKRAVENFLCKQMQKLIQKKTALENDKAAVKQWLLDMNNKLKTCVQDQEKEISVKNQDDGNTSCTEETINLKMLERQINLMLNRMDRLDMQVSRCYELLHDEARKKMLQCHIEEVIEQNELLCRELAIQQKKEDQMSEEIYNLTMEKKSNAIKLENKEIQLEVKSKQISTLQLQAKDLKEEIEKLNWINRQHIEKEKTLDDLKHIVQELQMSKKNMKDENELLRLKLEAFEQENSNRNSPRRTATSSRLYTNSKTYKYKSPRKKGQSASTFKT